MVATHGQDRSSWSSSQVSASFSRTSRRVSIQGAVLDRSRERSAQRHPNNLNAPTTQFTAGRERFDPVDDVVAVEIMDGDAAKPCLDVRGGPFVLLVLFDPDVSVREATHRSTRSAGV